MAHFTWAIQGHNHRPLRPWDGPGKPGHDTQYEIYR
jgi:hypothetical protein